MVVKQYINDYELIDIFRKDYQKKRYNKSVISYSDDHPNGLNPVISRSYFKLWEIMSSSGCLNQFKGKQINIANIAEGPGGFIHSLINFRNK